jgi:glyoxylase-like metal-dependent hydrolase (beta-lactamase superfamily II)
LKADAGFSSSAAFSGKWKSDSDFCQFKFKEAELIIKTLAVGPIMANCFILGCEETLEAAVIDPGDDADRILHALAESGLTVKFIINTHGHFDHVGANKRLHEVTGAPILIHPLDAPMLNQLSSSAAAWGLSADNSPAPDRELADGDEITFGRITLKVIHTPGHSPGGISLHTGDNVFVGDALFAGSIGRTDLPGGSFETLKESIQKKLFILGDNVKVHTGHGPSTTIGDERRQNPFVGEKASYFG